MTHTRFGTSVEAEARRTQEDLDSVTVGMLVIGGLLALRAAPQIVIPVVAGYGLYKLMSPSIKSIYRNFSD